MSVRQQASTSANPLGGHPTPGGLDAWDDYTPSESDFEFAAPEYASDPVEENSPHVTHTSRQNPRLSDIPELPPLPLSMELEDGQSRFDWRQRSLSQVRKKRTRGKKWFPEHHFERIQSEKGKLTWGDVYHDELERYKAHFVPLLLAESREEQRLFQVRLKEWPLQKLQREGFTLSNLRMVQSKYPTKQGGTVYEMKRDISKDMPLPFHSFTPGTTVILSKTDPLVDAILAGGKIGPLNEKTESLPAKVYSMSRNYIRIQTEEPIEESDIGTWRLDIGLSKWALQTQLNAILSLNNDPIQQDFEDTVQHDLAKQDLARLGSSRKEKPMLEQTILSGTGLRDKFLRAFQQDFVPYESTTSLSVNVPSAKSLASLAKNLSVDDSKVVRASGEDHIDIINDGIVAPQKALNAEDVDAKPTLAETNSFSGSLMSNQLIRSWAARHRAEGEIVRSDGDPAVPLNPSQMRAIAMMLSERLSLVQGGKTRVIIETIKLLKKHWQIPHPILVTAHTNVAVDNLVDGLRKNDLKAVRLGALERVRPDLHDWSFDIVSNQHPLSSKLDHLQKDADMIWTKNASGQYIYSSQERRALSKKIRGQMHRLRSAMFIDVLLDADVICTTCLSAASSYILKHIDFPIVFLDEASMATEPLSLVPLMKGSSHVAIIGDHKQLPPVIISDAAKAGGLATSLFERLIHERHVPSIMLDTQYRMHPDISAFPSKTFYNSDLKDGTRKADGVVVKGFETPVTGYLEDANGQPANMTFIDHQHPESPEMRSIANHGDAEIIGDIVVDLLLNNPTLRGSDIGIIAPYLAQIRAIDRKLNGDPIVLDAMADVLGMNRASEVQDIEIKTVDGFEGREKQVIIFSTVRSNDLGYIGFLADWRRLNVGITRAKRGLIIVGSAKTLEKAKISGETQETLPAGGPKVWRDFMAHLRSKGLVIEHLSNE